MDIRLEKAKRSLDGLSVGDAFGEQMFGASAPDLASRRLPPGPWGWTDDTHMALSIVEVLETSGGIDPDALAAAFARRFTQDPSRGYALGAARLLRAIADGGDWRELSPRLYGNGSFGNGAAMRVAPVGGFFCGEPGRAARQADLSAAVTHAHPEGRAGAMAVAAAAAVAAGAGAPRGISFLKAVLPHVPDGLTKERIETAALIAPDEQGRAVRILGTGHGVSAQDTVPFCLWCAAHRLDDYEDALWTTAKGGGDVDTTCAIVGGIVALSAPEIPAAWRERREPLPD